MSAARKSAPPLSEDWAPGDLATPVPGYWKKAPPPGWDYPQEGRNYLVLEVYLDGTVWGLSLAGLRPGRCPCGKPGRGYAARGFRKVFPDRSEEPRLERAPVKEREPA